MITKPPLNTTHIERMGKTNRVNLQEYNNNDKDRQWWKDDWAEQGPTIIKRVMRWKEHATKAELESWDNKLKELEKEHK